MNAWTAILIVALAFFAGFLVAAHNPTHGWKVLGYSRKAWAAVVAAWVWTVCLFKRKA